MNILNICVLLTLKVATSVQNAVQDRTKITQGEPPVNYVQLGCTKQTLGRLVVYHVKQEPIKVLKVGVPFSGFFYVQEKKSSVVSFSSVKNIIHFVKTNLLKYIFIN